MRKAALALVFLLAASPAWASYHLMKIVEVFPGTMAQPNAQYVKLQMYLAGQNFVSTHKVTVYNAAGTVVGTYTFAADLGNGTNQAQILIGTAESATLFQVANDLTMTPTIAKAGGKVCFDAIPEDCVAWGNYTGATTGVGQPAYQQRGLINGRALKRNLKGNTTLDAADDTDASNVDFADGLPAPQNNVGLGGTPPASTCGNNAIEGLESCDDSNTTANDGCSATCVTESCGDGIVQTAEQCDDTNSNNTDTCSNTCMTQMAQPDAPPDAAPNPPDGPINPTTGDGGGGCCDSGPAGASPLLGLALLAFIVRRRRR